MGVKGYRVWYEKSRKVLTSRDVKFNESSKIICPWDIVVTNNEGTTHGACEEVEPPMSLKATRAENDMYQLMESTSHNVHRSKSHVKTTRRYIEECDYVAYALRLQLR